MSYDVTATTPQRWIRRVLILLGILLFAFGVYLLVLDVWLTDNTSYNASQTYAMFLLMNSAGFYANYGELARQSISAITDPVGQAAVTLVPVIANKTYFLGVGLALVALGILMPRLMRLPGMLTATHGSRSGPDDASAPPFRYADRRAPEPVREAPRPAPAAEGYRRAPEPAREAPRRSPGLTADTMLPPLDRAVGVPREMPVDTGGRVCPACGMPVTEGNAVCVYCGRPLSAQAFCQLCGKPLQPDDRFCAFCAAPVEAPSPVDAPTPEYDAPAPRYDVPAPTPPAGYRPSGEHGATKGLKIPTGL